MAEVIEMKQEEKKDGKWIWIILGLLGLAGLVSLLFGLGKVSGGETGETVDIGNCNKDNLEYQVCRYKVGQNVRVIQDAEIRAFPCIESPIEGTVSFPAPYIETKIAGKTEVYELTANHIFLPITYHDKVCWVPYILVYPIEPFLGCKYSKVSRATFANGDTVYIKDGSELKPLPCKKSKTNITVQYTLAFPKLTGKIEGIYAYKDLESNKFYRLVSFEGFYPIKNFILEDDLIKI